MMTPAEFEVMRRRLGLSIEEVAALCEVTPKTVNRWLRGTLDIHDDVAGRLDRLAGTMVRQVEFAAGLVTDAVQGGTLPITLYRSRDAYAAGEDKDDVPHGAHMMMAIWLGDALREEGYSPLYFFADDLNGDAPAPW